MQKWAESSLEKLRNAKMEREGKKDGEFLKMEEEEGRRRRRREVFVFVDLIIERRG